MGGATVQDGSPAAARPRRSVPRPPRWLLGLGVAVALLAIAPLVYLGIRAADAVNGPLELVLRPRTLELLANTLALGVVVGAGAVAVGLPLGWLTSRTDLPGRRAWSVLVVVPLAIPSYVLAFALIATIGPRGALRELLAPLGVESLPSLYGFPGAALVLVLATYPYVTLAVAAVLRRTDASLTEAARMLGDTPRDAFRRAVLPLLVPAISAGALLAVLYAIADFGSVSLLQFDSFARAIHVQYRVAFDRSLAAVLALILAVLAIGVALLEAGVRQRRPPIVPRARSRPPAAVALGRWRWPAVAFCGLVVSFALVIPVVTLVAWLARGLRTDNVAVGLLAAVGNTLLAGTAAAALAVVLAAPLAALAARWPSRTIRFLEGVSLTAYALPGIVVALAVVFLAIRLGPVAYQTFGLLVLAYAVRFLPLATAPIRDGLATVNPSVEASARLLGRGPFETLRDVTLPLLRPGVIAAASLVFLMTVKELPMTLLLGPAGFGTLATSVWGSVGDGFYARAAAPALLLVAVSTAGVGLLLREDPR